MSFHRYNPCTACQVRDQTICGALRAHELERLNEIVTEVHLHQGQVLFHQEDPADSLFNVTSGHIRVLKLLPDGRRQIVGFMYPGDFLGVAFISEYVYTAEAIDDVVLCRFPRQKLEAFIEEVPELEKRLLEIASNELLAAQDLMLLLGRKSAIEKLASFLVRMAWRTKAKVEGLVELHLPMNRHDIADYLGLSTETVSRTFTELTKRAAIELPSADRVVIRDIDTLEQITEGG